MRWLTTIIFILAAARVSADDLVTGKKVYTSRCARCHKFYDPTAYDDAKWSEWMQKMKLKAKLSDAQYQQLTNYVTTLRPGNKP
jgi:mono/diheme cytochrome c family protein